MAALRDIVDEGVLGASNHVTLALPLVARLAAAPRPTAPQEALTLAAFIAETRGRGAPIVANALGWLTAGVAAMPPDDAMRVLATRAERWQMLARERRAKLVASAVETLAARRAPLLYDFSSTVAEIVRALAECQRLDRIVVPESRAIDGGRRYLAALADLPVEAVYVPDAALDYAVGQADAVLLGAESLTRDGGILNTVGSLLAARCAELRGVPVYGAADLFKVGPARAADLPPPDLRRYEFLLQPGETALTEAPELELVPPAQVTALLTEAGSLPPAGVWDAADEVIGEGLGV